jgi:hypothetical protein
MKRLIALIFLMFLVSCTMKCQCGPDPSDGKLSCDCNGPHSDKSQPDASIPIVEKLSTPYTIKGEGRGL